MAVYMLHQSPNFYFLWNGIFHCDKLLGTEYWICYGIFVVVLIFIAAYILNQFYECVVYRHLIASTLDRLLRRVEEWKES